MQRIIIIISAILTTMNLQAQHPTIPADVHSHIVTKEYMDYLRANHADMEDGYPLPDWSAEEHLRFMDDAGIAWSVLTMPSPQPFFEDAHEAAKIIHSVNEVAWRTREKYPDRFKFCAAVPLPDVNLAIEEAIYALDTLKADGIKLATNSRGQYLGDPALEPLMQVLNDRKATVIIHPHKPTPVQDDVFTGGPIFVYEYPAETTHAVLNMIAHDVLVRYPDLKIIVPHAGSFLPYAIPRLRAAYPLLVAKGIAAPFDIDGNLKGLYYDLAGGPSSEAVKMMLTITTPDHIMYGSDYGFVSGEVLARLLRNIEAYLDADPELQPYKNMFLRENAERLFNRSDADIPTGQPVAMCRKESMQADGIVRLSKVEVHPEYLDEYMAFAKEVGATSLCTEPGVLTMYAVADKENPCRITILETYSSQEAYKKHIASEHFQKYKQGTLHMVKNLVLDDVVPLNPDNRISNFIRH